MCRGKELSQDLHNEMTEQHSNGTGSQQISQLRNVPRSSIMTMICKWKEHHLTISQSVDQKSHSRTKEHSKSLRKICKQWVHQAAQSTAMVSVLSPSPEKTSLLKKKHVEACLTFAPEHFEMFVKLLENVVYSDETF